MTGPDTPVVDGTPCGVFAWRPPAALVDGAERRARPRGGGVIDASDRSTSAARCARAGLLRAFNDAGVLAAADVHVARRLAALAGEADDGGRARRRARRARAAARHVYVDLATIRDDRDGRRRRAGRPVGAAVAGAGRLAARASRASPLVAVGEDDAARPPAAARRHAALPRPLLARGAPGRGRPARAGRARRRPASTRTLLADRARRGCSAAGRDDGQRARRRGRGAAALRGRRRRPGHRQDDDGRADRRAARRAGRGAGAPPPLVALAAPTGKAAARLEEAVHDEARGLDVDAAGARAAARRSAPRRCTGCSAGGRAATAASATTAATGCRTTS